MNIIKADIWSYADSHHIVVGTNIGWDESADPPMRNNMGAGLAAQARDRYRRLAWWYGLRCCTWWLEQADPITAVMPPQIYHEPHGTDRLILLPVKPLNTSHPDRSWDQKACVQLITEGLRWLRTEEMPIAIPLVGAGNGELDPDVVLGLIKGLLHARPRTIVVDNR